MSETPPEPARVMLNPRELRELAELVKRRLNRLTGRDVPLILIVQPAFIAQYISNVPPDRAEAMMIEAIETNRARHAAPEAVPVREQEPAAPANLDKPTEH